jgi:hypothetical protein
VERLEEREVPTAISWTGGGDQTSWNDAKNWSSLTVPGINDDVTINVAGAKIGIATPVTVNTLNLNISGQNTWLSLPGDGKTDLTILGLFTWTDGELLSGPTPGHVLANGGVSMSGGATFGALPLACALDNVATATINGVELAAGAGAWNNLAGSELDFVNNGNFAGVLNNSGVIVNKSLMSNINGSGTSSGLTNQGSIDVQSGTLSLSGQVDSTGPISVPAGSTLDFGQPAGFNAGATLGLGGTVTGAGNVNFISASAVTMADTYNVSGLTQVIGAGFGGPSEIITFNGPTTMGSLTISSTGTIAGSGDVTVSGPLVVDQGSMTGAGRTLIQGSSSIDSLTLDGRTVDNFGSCSVNTSSGSTVFAYLFDGAVWNNESGGVMDLQASISMTWGNIGATPQLNNAGTLEWPSVAGGLGFQCDFPVTNSGLLELQGQSSLITLGQNLINSGTVSIDSGSTLAITGTYQQTSAGALDIGVGGSSAGFNGILQDSGAATVAGTLNVTLQDGYVPHLNDFFLYLTCSSESGDFATKNGLSLGNNLNFIPTNSSTGLGLQVTQAAGAATHVAVSAPSSTTAGNAFNFTIKVLDANNNVATGYLGTVHFTSTDPAALLPSDYTFKAADNGVHTFSATLKTAGTQSITATDTQTSSITGAQSLVVTPAAANTLTVAGFPSTTTAGIAQNFTVTAIDAYGNIATGYAGAIHFTTTSKKAVLPANYTFTVSDAGSHTFTANLETSGAQSITATDTKTATIKGTESKITVNAAALAGFSLTGFPTSTTAGKPGSITVTAVDAFGNKVTSYQGAVHFTSSDPKAILPADYTFTAADKGVHAFKNGVTLKTAGTQSITATDTLTSSITGQESKIKVNAAAASLLVVSGFPTTATAGQAYNLTITAEDTYGNVATGYTGTVHFTSSDLAAVLPANYPFKNTDKGIHTFSATLKTKGTQSITATDTLSSSITGSEMGILVV